MRPEDEQKEGFYADGHTSVFEAGDLARPAPTAPVSSTRGIEWEASEYVHHDKGASWLVVLGVVAVVPIAAALWFQQWIFAALLLLMAITFGYYAVRKPQVVHYKLTDSHLDIATKSYPLNEFSSFGVIAEGAFYSVRLIPTKRLRPATVIYFGEEEGEKIVDILGSQLAMQPMEPDPIDVIMRKLRF